MNIKQAVTVTLLLIVCAGTAFYNRTDNVENTPAVESSYESKAPDFDSMKILKEYTVPDTEIIIRAADNEAFTSFGPGSVTIYRNDKEICRKQIANDGGMLNSSNIDITSDNENIYILPLKAVNRRMKR